MLEQKPPDQVKVEIKMEPESDSEDETLDRLAVKMRDESLFVKIERVDVKAEPIDIKVEIQEIDNGEESSEANLSEIRISEESKVPFDVKNILPKTVTSKKARDPTQCEICLKRYRNKHGVNSHKKKMHLGQALAGRSECPVCNKKYTNRKCLESHLEQMHLKNMGEGTKFPCLTCGQVFLRRNSLWMHRYNKHSEVDLTRICPHCNKKLKNPRSLREHILKLHPLEYLGKDHDPKEAEIITRPFECNDCKKRFTNKWVLKKHIDIVHSSVFFCCQHCPKRFKSRFHLENHLACTHSSIEDLRTCLICYKVFKNRISFKYHTRCAHSIPATSGICRPSTIEEVMMYKRKYDPGASILP